MTDTYSQCPKCGHQMPQPMPASAACPACGIYFFKYAQDAAVIGLRDDVRTDAFDGDEPGVFAALLKPMDKMDSATFYGRCVALAGLAVWSIFLFGYDYRTGEMGSSFMHDILLPIHEAGHVLFRPLGNFMMILGGSLFQVLLPLAIGIAFIAKNRDNFGAAVGLWLASVSLVDLSPYIYDALHPQLILLGGHTGEDGPHDWIYLLLRLGQLANAQHWGAFAHALGGVLMLLTLLWGAYILVQQHKQAGRME